MARCPRENIARARRVLIAFYANNIVTITTTIIYSTVTNIVVAAAGSGGDVGGVEGSTDTTSGPIANHRCHNVQLPDRSRRLLIVYRANATDNRGRDLRFGITFCSYDCTMLLMLLLLLLLLLVLLTVTLVITAATVRASLGSGNQIPLLLKLLMLLLLLLVVLLTFRRVLSAGGLQIVAS